MDEWAIRVGNVVENAEVPMSHTVSLAQGKHSAAVPLSSLRIRGQQASIRKSDGIIRL